MRCACSPHPRVVGAFADEDGIEGGVVLTGRADDFDDRVAAFLAVVEKDDDDEGDKLRKAKFFASCTAGRRW